MGDIKEEDEENIVINFRETSGISENETTAKYGIYDKDHFGEEEIDDDEETALNEEEIDDDEDTAMVSGRGSKMVPDTLTISQFNPLTSTHMTFTRANDGGQETVNLSIPDTAFNPPCK